MFTGSAAHELAPTGNACGAGAQRDGRLSTSHANTPAGVPWSLHGGKVKSAVDAARERLSARNSVDGTVGQSAMSTPAAMVSRPEHSRLAADSAFPSRRCSDGDDTLAAQHSAPFTPDTDFALGTSHSKRGVHHQQRHQGEQETPSSNSTGLVFQIPLLPSAPASIATNGNPLAPIAQVSKPSQPSSGEGADDDLRPGGDGETFGTFQHSAVTFGLDGDVQPAGMERRSSLTRRRRSVGNGEKNVSFRRNRAFGGFDDKDALKRDASGDESDYGSAAVRPLAAAKQVGINPLTSVGNRSLSGILPPQLTQLRRQSYAVAEAQSVRFLPPQRLARGYSVVDLPAAPGAPRKQSVVNRRPETTNIEDFNQALQSALQHPLGDSLAANAKRRQSMGPGEMAFDFTGVFGVDGGAEGTPDDDVNDNTLLLPQHSNLEADARTHARPRRTSQTHVAHAKENSDSDGDGSSVSDGSSVLHRNRSAQMRNLLIGGDLSMGGTTDSRRGSSDNIQGNRDGTKNPVEGKSKKERSEVEMHLYRSSLISVPLQFVVQEVHARIVRDRMLVDLVYFIPFVVVFTLFFLSRDITNNFYAVGSLTSSNVASETYAQQVNIMNEFFRIDTDEYDGNQAVYIQDDGTNIRDNVFGPQNYRVGGAAVLPKIPNILEVRSKVGAYRWLKHVFVPLLWDCSNPDYRNPGKTNVGGNTVLVGGARLKSVRVVEGCEAPNSELWHHPSENWDLGCYSALSDINIDSTLYCNVSNPAAVEIPPVAARLQQTTPVTSRSSGEDDGPASTEVVTALNETLFPFLECEMTSTTGASSQGRVKLRHPCAGHYMTLPFQASCNDVRAAVDVLRPDLMEPAVFSQNPNARVLHDVMEEYNTRVPSNSCSAFLFHQSVRLFVAEYFSYSVYTDSFFRSRMTLEITEGGAVLPSHNTRMFRVWTSSSIYQVFLQGVVLIFVANFVMRTLNEWSISKKLSGSYFTFLMDPWNMMDVVNNVTLLASAILTALWWSASQGFVLRFNRDPHYPGTLEVVEEYFTMQVYCNAVNVVMIFLKVLKFLRINDRLSIMTRTLGECQQEIISLMLLFLFIHAGFSIMATSVFGAAMFEFRSVDSSFVTLFFALLIGVDYDAMRNVQPALTPLFFWLFIVMEVYLLLNFFIAILGEGFAQVSQSMHLPSLDMALLRVVDEVRMVFRWSFLREVLLSLTTKKKRDHVQSLVKMHACLQEHLRLSLIAVEDLRFEARHENVSMHYRDMEWWLPKDVYDSLGPQYLLLLWEEIVYTHNIKEKMNAKTAEKTELARSIRQGVEEMAFSFPDVLSLEVQAEVIFEKLEKLPLKLVEWSIHQEAQKKAMSRPSSSLRRASVRRRASVVRKKPTNPEEELLGRLASPMFEEKPIEE